MTPGMYSGALLGVQKPETQYKHKRLDQVQDAYMYDLLKYWSRRMKKQHLFEWSIVFQLFIDDIYCACNFCVVCFFYN